MLVSCPDSIQKIKKGSGNTVWVQDCLSYDDVIGWCVFFQCASWRME